MSFKNGLAITACAALSLFSANALAQTQPAPKPLVPHYLFGVPLPKFKISGTLFKPSFYLGFPSDPKRFQHNKLDTVEKIVTDDRRVHPVLKIEDAIVPPFQLDTLQKDVIPSLNLT